MTLPNFIVIGAAKAGTTALYWYLAEHPAIFMSPVKETNYFAYGLDDAGQLRFGDPDVHRFPVKSLAAYEALFAGAGDAVAIGEASTMYLECPQAAARIHDLLPATRIICGLREPVDRAYSDYLMYLRNRGVASTRHGTSLPAPPGHARTAAGCGSGDITSNCRATSTRSLGSKFTSSCSTI